MNSKKKIEVLIETRISTNIFINEKENELAYAVRVVKKQGKISATCTRECKVYIRTMGNPEIAKTHCIRD